MKETNLPVQLQQLLNNLLDKSVSVYTRVNYRSRVEEINQIINKALITFDKEYTEANKRK